MRYLLRQRDGILHIIIRSKRDLKNARRTSRIEALSIAYKAFVRAGIDRDGLIIRGENDEIIDKATPVENAIAIVHLYGDKEQSELASECAKQLGSTGKVQLTSIVNSLRRDIREMLGEEDIVELPYHLSIERKKNHIKKA